MYRPNQKDNHPAICDFIPGYAYYNGMGYGLAETLLNLIEWLLGLRR
jgi:hypothetical protein